MSSRTSGSQFSFMARLADVWSSWMCIKPTENWASSGSYKRIMLIKDTKANNSLSHNVSIYLSFELVLFYLNEIKPVLKFPPWRGGRLYVEVLNLFFFEAIPAGQLLSQHQQLILSPYYDLLNKPWCTDWFLGLQPLPNSSV